jgi:hypothetical protein
MQIKTSELTGAALDWAVAKTADYLTQLGDHWMVTLPKVSARMNFVPGPRCVFTPSTRWAQGGPIIEQELIELSIDGASNDGMWVAKSPDWHAPASGPTPLVAAMRCYVAAKLGDTVDVPPQPALLTPMREVKPSNEYDNAAYP